MLIFIVCMLTHCTIYCANTAKANCRCVIVGHLGRRYVGISSVTKIFTIVEILKIYSKIFSNKNTRNCVLLYKFSLKKIFFYLFHKFSPHFHKNNSTISKNALVTLGIRHWGPLIIWLSPGLVKKREQL